MMKKCLLLMVWLLCLAMPALADAPELSFSLESGFYAGPQQLKITCDDRRAVIYYTLDGSTPDAAAVRYEGPITLDWSAEREDVLTKIGGVSASGDFLPEQDFPTGHILRAVAIAPNGETSAVVSGTYFIGYDRKTLYGDMPIMLLAVDPADLFGHEKGIYVLGKVYEEWAAAQTEAFKPRNAQANYTQRGKEWERPVTVTFLPGDGAKGFTQDMGLRIKGDASRLYPQKSLRLIAREEYGAKNIKYPIFPDNLRQADGKVVEKYKSFTLRNGGNDCDYAKIRDPYITRLAAGMNLDSAASMPCIAFINGEYWGLYTLTEEITANSIQYHYDIDSANVIIVKCGEVEDGEDADIRLYEEMFDFIAKADMTDPANYKKAGELLALDSFADLCAVQLYTGNNDGIFQYNNWQMWRVRKPERTHAAADGKWRMILYDSDITAGVFTDGQGGDTDDLTPAVTGSYSGKHPARLFASLMKNAAFREKVIQALCDLRNLHFSPARATALLEEMKADYLPYVPDTLRRFGPDWVQWGPEMYYESQLKKLDGYFDTRREAFMPMMQQAFGLGEPCRVTVRISDPAKGEVYLNGSGVSAENDGEYLYFAEFGLDIAAVPARGAKFTGWTVSVNGAVLSPKDKHTSLTFQGDVILTANFK